MAHKREERAKRDALRKERQARKHGYLEGDENFVGFSNQLATQGLKLKDIPGDGNCLFRALADQLEGDMSEHMRHRRETVDYIIQHRSEFEPFVEDGQPFERYVRNLAQNGTFGGNDALVAFSRLHNVNIIIHRFNEPCLQVTASDSPSARELHVSYHNGDHYSSVRRITDPGVGPGVVEHEKLPTKSDKKARHQSRHKVKSSVETNEMEGTMIETVTSATQCRDVSLIEQTLVDTSFDVDATISMILQLMDIQEASTSSHKPHSVTQEPKLESSQTMESSRATACALSVEANKGGNAVMNSSQMDSKNKPGKPRERLHDESRHLSNRQRKEKAKRERKERRLDEQRGRARTSHHQLSSQQDNNMRDLDRTTAAMETLSI